MSDNDKALYAESELSFDRVVNLYRKILRRSDTEDYHYLLHPLREIVELILIPVGVERFGNIWHELSVTQLPRNRFTSDDEVEGYQKIRAFWEVIEYLFWHNRSSRTTHILHFGYLFNWRLWDAFGTEVPLDLYGFITVVKIPCSNRDHFTEDIIQKFQRVIKLAMKWLEERWDISHCAFLYRSMSKLLLSDLHRRSCRDLVKEHSQADMRLKFFNESVQLNGNHTAIYNAVVSFILHKL